MAKESWRDFYIRLDLFTSKTFSASALHPS